MPTSRYAVVYAGAQVHTAAQFYRDKVNMRCHAVLCRAVPHCAVLCCAVLCCAVLCCASCAVQCGAVPCRAVLCCAVLLHVMKRGMHTRAKRCCLLTWICHYMNPLQACWHLNPSPQQWHQQLHGPLGLRLGEPEFIACQHHLGYYVWSMAPMLSALHSMLL